ncbi:MAG: T9SS type A sorting domain-containing protein, partial [Tannerella sp.]|jgi:hypothetical protein|nr:T9SS type A sorting domain-containing protein [Tannerella sp.]
VGKPVLSDITGPTGISNTQSATYQAIYNSLANPSSFQWILSPLGNASAIPENQYFDVGIGTPGSYQVVCRATNACGQGEYFVIDVNVYHSYGNYSSAYPNPVSGILNIDVNRETEALQKKSVASAGCEFALDIRLYDSRGNLQRQATSKGEKVVFNVSNLPNGLYILHVYDGIQENPEIHKIIVKH